MAGVPWPLLPYSSRRCHFQARGSVVLPDPMIELAGQTADHRLVAGVGETESAARQAAQMRVRADDDDRLAHATRLHRGHHAGRSRAIDDQVLVPRCLCRRRGQRGDTKERKREQAAGLHGVEFATRGARR